MNVDTTMSSKLVSSGNSSSSRSVLVNVPFVCWVVGAFVLRGVVIWAKQSERENCRFRSVKPFQLTPLFLCVSVLPLAVWRFCHADNENKQERLLARGFVLVLTQVAWNDESNPAQGFKYLYLSPEDYGALPEGTVNAKEVTEGGDKRFALTDIIGQVINLVAFSLSINFTVVVMMMLKALFSLAPSRCFLLEVFSRTVQDALCSKGNGKQHANLDLSVVKGSEFSLSRHRVCVLLYMKVRQWNSTRHTAHRL